MRYASGFGDFQPVLPSFRGAADRPKPSARNSSWTVPAGWRS